MILHVVIIPLISWIELSAGFFGIPGPGGIQTNTYLSNEDISEAYNLTSWISNKTSREILRQYITVCPGQDMCHGDTFIRQYIPGFDMVPACTKCNCDDSCIRKSNCCPSKFLRIENRSDIIEKIPEKDSLNKPPIACVQPLWNESPNFNVQAYWIIKSCLNGDPCDIQEKNLISSTPVTSISSNETYLDVQCALCNNESAPNLIFWKQDQVVCTDRAHLLLKKENKILPEMTSHPNPNCNVLFNPPGPVIDLIKPCIFVENERNPCTSPGGLANERPYLQQACDSYHLPYSTCYRTFKNVFCALCQTPSIKDLPIECNKDVSFSPNQFPMFSALMNFDKDREPVAAAHDRSCGVGQVYDKRMNECLNVTCEAEYMLERNLECRPMHQEWGENNYEVNMVFRPTHEADKEHLSVMPSPLTAFLENRMTHNNIFKYLCSIQIFELNENGVKYLGALIELTVNHWHDIDEMIDKLTKIFSIDHDIALFNIYYGYNVNVSSSIIGQRFHLYRKSRYFSSLSARQYFDPMSFEAEYVAFSTDLTFSRKFCTKLSSTIVVADWYRCPKVKIKTTDAKIGLANYSLCLVDYDHCIPSSYFKRSRNNLQFDVCVDWYFRTFNQVSSPQTSSDDEVNIYLSLVCLSLSSVGSMMTIISYMIKKESVNAGDTNVIILSVFLIVANTIYTFSTFFQWSKTLCVTVGMLVHFFWLSVVFWMSLCSFKVFETFTNFAVVKLNQTSDVFCRLVLNCLLCLGLVGTNIIVSHIESDGQSLGYSPRTCYIENSRMILYTFTLPVGVTVCVNTFMFVVTVSRIHGKGDVRKSKDQERVSAYFRLSTLTGMSWLFGFLGQFTNLQVFSVLHTVFSAGQGIFLYLAFGRQKGGSCKCVKDRTSER